jgi:hypothetical protein
VTILASLFALLLLLLPLFSALVVPDVGEVELLDKTLKDALSVDESYTLKLYTAISPALGEGSVAGDFTEATFTGYAAKTLTRAGWAGASTSSGTTSSSYAQQSWSPTSAQTVLGYYVIGTTSGVLLWAEAFASSRSLQNGDTLLLTPKMELA